MSFSTIKNKYGTCSCGCGKEGRIYAKGMLAWCYDRERKRRYLGNRNQVKVSAKRVSTMKENKLYYRCVIGANITKNRGKCLCDECRNEIKKPTGRNVCHILAWSAYPTPLIYHHKRNHFILGKGVIFGECSCGEQFDEGDKKSMAIYQESEEIKIELKALYYSN